MAGWSEEYKTKVRKFIASHGSMVQVADRRYEWEEVDEVSTYGWRDYESVSHVRSTEGGYPGEGCHWIVPEGARLYERTYSMFTDTFHDNKDEVGVNVTGCRCACGRYQDVILRWTGSMAEMLHAILDLPDARTEVIL